MSILDRFRLDGKVALVTGAGKGIGAACAKAFAEAGADVVIGARTVGDLERVAEAARGNGRQAIVAALDVTDADQRESIVERAIQSLGRLDILVNNVGGSMPKAALETSVKEFDHAFHFNVTTAFAMTQLAAVRMVETAGAGAVINIASVAGQAPGPHFAAYGTAKAGMIFLTRVLAQEFAPKVRVNAIGVGSTKTDALKRVLDPGIEKAMVRMTPMNRLGEVEDVAACALYLASPASSYLTGDVVQVNGGLRGLNMTMPRAFD